MKFNSLRRGALLMVQEKRRMKTPLPETPLDETAPAEAPSPSARNIRNMRWFFIVAAVMLLGLVAVYQVPVWLAGAAFAALAAAAAWPLRGADAARMKIARERDARRQWVGVGMKVAIDALPAPCFIADARGITQHVNKEVVSAYNGVKPGDPLSFSLRTPSILEAFERVSSSGRAERIAWEEKVPAETWLEAHIAPVYLPDGVDHGSSPVQPDFVLVMVQDLTENRRLERMRTDFVANASHELRTPLASLTGFIETLQGPARDDLQARDRFLTIMLDQSGRMRRLIDDILSLSRIELKANVRPQGQVDLCEVVRHSADALSPLAAELGMEIRLDLPEGSAPVAGDRDELIQVAENLIENALKYGSTGKYVDVGLAGVANEGGEGEGGNAEGGNAEGENTEGGDSEGGDCEWSLSIRDHGEGIAPEHLPRLTERFYRVDVESSRAMKGTGLGLAIVKHILTRHQARMEVDSVPGQGATFTVRISAGSGKDHQVA